AHLLAAICRRLDGLPLALELAAARVKHLTLRELHDRLMGETPLSILSDGPCDLPDHQQTMRSAIAWSYRLLTSEEQRLFRVLCVFAGEATGEAVAAIAGISGERLEAVLQSLVDKSLVQHRAEEGSCYLLLALLRAYGLEQAREQGDLEALQRGHAAVYVALAEEANQQLEGRDQMATLARLEREHDNFRAALQWLQAHGEITAALHLAGKLWLFWYLHGHLCEGR